MSVSAAREAVLQQTADTLLTARRSHTPIADLPEPLRPAGEDEAIYVRDVVAAAYGEIGGWKIGASSTGAPPAFSPMPIAWMGKDGTIYRDTDHRLRGVEAEIAFQLTADLPPRSTPYTRADLVAAVTCHPAIEILESAFIDPTSVPRPTLIADLQMHGGFVSGPAVPGWQTIDWAQEKVTLLTDAVVRVDGKGSSPGGQDIVSLLVFLANEGAARTGGLKRGDWVTTGSWTGATWASASAQITVRFEHAGTVSLQFETSKT